MDNLALFQAALSLPPPWEVESVTFDSKEEKKSRQLEMRIGFPRGSKFPCPECRTPCPAHDTHEQRWRHLDFFQHEAYLVARVPRTSCKAHGVRTIDVPWARPGSGFTLLFEAYVMMMAGEMPMSALAKAVGEHDTRLWRIATAHVEEARERVDMSQVKSLVVDETSQARRHTYVSVFLQPGKDQQKPRVLFVADGRRAEVFDEFVEDLEAHGGSADKIVDVSMDMSPSFQKGAADALPDARVTFDPFHVAKLVGEAVDEVRRAEQITQPMLKSTRYTWLTNPENMTALQFQNFSSLYRLNLKTVEAYHMRLNLRQVWKQKSFKAAKTVLLEWCRWVRRAAKPHKDGTATGLEPMLRVATTIRKKMTGILNHFRSGLTQGVIEGLNSRLQAARARARGYRNPETFKTMIYLLAGRLEFDLPSLSH